MDLKRYIQNMWDRLSSEIGFGLHFCSFGQGVGRKNGTIETQSIEEVNRCTTDRGHTRNKMIRSWARLPDGLESVNSYSQNSIRTNLESITVDMI